MDFLKKNFIFQDVNKLEGVGPKLTKYLKKKKIEKIKDIILNLPYSETDRSKLSNLNELERTLDRIIEPGDLLLTMGAGDIWRYNESYVEHMKKKLGKV